MKTNVKIAPVLVAGALLFAAAAQQAFAGSAMTDAFIANVKPNVDYLDESSRLAIDKSSSARIRNFAHDEAREQTIASNSLVAWIQTNTQGGQAIATGTPVADLAAAPVDVAADVAASATDLANGLVTGRSVAIDRPLTVTRAPVAAQADPGLLPAGQADLSRLKGLRGRAFDALYKSTQRDALRQLATLYRDYAVKGEDPTLRTMATRELSKINTRMTELRRL